MSNILIGVTGGIAAYKVPAVGRLLIKAGHSVRFMMTTEGMKFIGSATLAAISGSPVSYPSKDTGTMNHIELAKWADICLIAPATANTIGKYASGIADSEFLSTLLALASPLIIAPAMNTNMFFSRPVQTNLAKIKSWGVYIIEPADGELACGDTGKGRMREPEEIANVVLEVLGVSMAALPPAKYVPVNETDVSETMPNIESDDKVKSMVDAFCNKSVGEYLAGDESEEDNAEDVGSGKPMDGLKVLVTAGPTKEYIDPVRYITNRSSGKMGYAIAEAAYDFGADVTLVSGDVAITSKVPGIIKAATSFDMAAAVSKLASDADIIIMAAAVADYTPKQTASEKIKKTSDTMSLELVKTTDILKEVGLNKRSDQILIGFAAETQHLESNAQAKLEEKNLDLIIANDVSRSDIGFDSDDNEVMLFFKGGKVTETGKRSKAEIAKIIVTEGAIMAAKVKDK